MSAARKDLGPAGPLARNAHAIHPACELSDEELFARHLEGDDEAAAALEARHFPMVLRFFRIKLERGAEKLAETTFAGFLESSRAAAVGNDTLLQTIEINLDDPDKNVPTPEPPEGVAKFEHPDASTFRAQLLFACRRKLLRRLKRILHENHPRDAFDPQSTSIKATVQDDRTRISRRMAQHAEEELILGIVRHLPVDFQIALELRYWEDLTPPEIAAVLECEPAAVQRFALGAVHRLKQYVLLHAEDKDFARRVLADLEGWVKSLRRVYLGGPQTPQPPR